MDQTWKQDAVQTLRDFHLPAYEDIPDVGLFLEQVTRYINGYFAALPHGAITASMISNYVKKGIIGQPQRKRYSREQIARLFFITAAKSVLTLEELQAIFRVQRRSYPAHVAYDYFRAELENVLYYVFGLKATLDTVGSEQTEEKIMLRNTIIAAAHRLYLAAYLHALSEETHEPAPGSF